MIIDTARHPLIAQITPGPKAPSRALLEGRAIDTCGFVSGDQNSPLTCPAGYTCTVDAAFFGCCGQLGCQSNWHTCVPHDSPDCAGDNLSICSEIYTSVLICPQESPACVTYDRSTVVGGTGLTSYACGASPTQIHVRLEPTTGAGLAAQSIQGQDGTVGSGAIGSSAAATTSSAPTTDTTSSSTTTQQAITSESNISSSSFETISSTTIATSQSSSNSLSSVTSVSSTTAATTSQDSNGSSSFTTISSSATPTTSESSGGSDSGGLSNSDKIVLATSLPGLALTALIAGLTYVLVKRSKEKKKQKDPVKKNKTPPKTI